MKKAKLLRRIFYLLYATCLVCILWMNFSPGNNAMAVSLSPSDPDNPKEANQQSREQREARANENAQRNINNERASAKEHTLRIFGDFSKGLLQGIPPGMDVENAFKEVVAGCSTCHEPEIIDKLRERYFRSRRA
jgi:hypothetical protein